MACWNRCVFSFFLKMIGYGEFLMDFGSWFHNVGAEYLRYHASKVWHLTFGMCNMVPVLLECMLSCFLWWLGPVSTLVPCWWCIWRLLSGFCILSFVVWETSVASLVAHDKLKYLLLFQVKLGADALYGLVFS